MNDPYSAAERTKYFAKSACAVVWSMPFTVLGLLLCLTLIGAPLGLLVLLIGAAPLVAINKSRALQIHNYMMREHALPSDGVEPWITDMIDGIPAAPTVTPEPPA